MFRHYLGVDVTAGELRAVRLGRKGRKTTLLGGRVLSLAAGVLQVSPRAPNIADLPRFVDALREVLIPLAGREDRVALSLPDMAGRLLFAEVENSFKTRAEGIDILKWQLKGSLPADAREVRLDYQVLETSESGRLRLLVAIMAEKVLFPYEEALAAAGFQTAVVDFHSLSLYNFYQPRLDLGENFVLVGIEKNQLSLQHFHGRTLAFHRARQVAPMADSVFQELNRSLVAGQEVSPALPRAAVFVHSDLEEHRSILEAVRSAFAREVVTLDPHLDRLVPAAAGGPLREERGLAAAVGAAERMM
jgi:type IV pilus assembly protein PilM